MLRPSLRAAALALGLAALPLAGHAHVDGSAHHGFGAGVAHPFTGLDHLVAMLAVGVWGALTARRADVRHYLSAPLAFASLLLAGALLGAGGVLLPGVETMIATSLLVLGLLVALRVSAPAWAGAALVGAFAIFHGAAHGTELAGAEALAGMLLATVALHATGLGIGHLLRGRSPWWPRAAGLAATLFGAVSLIG